MKKLPVFLLFLTVGAVSAHAEDHFLDSNWWKTATVADVQKEIKNGADVNARTEDGLTPLMLAARDNRTPEVTLALIKNGADMNARAEYGDTPLMIAAGFNPNPEVILALIKNGADVNARAEYGFTLLMLAARDNRTPEVISALIKNGANVKAQDNNGRTALDYAKDNPKIYKSKAYWELNDLMYR